MRWDGRYLNASVLKQYQFFPNIFLRFFTFYYANYAFFLFVQDIVDWRERWYSKITLFVLFLFCATHYLVLNSISNCKMTIDLLSNQRYHSSSNFYEESELQIKTRECECQNLEKAASLKDCCNCKCWFTYFSHFPFHFGRQFWIFVIFSL